MGKTATHLIVNETFRTFQGEGPSTGRPAHFIRLNGCNLHCRWCDTPFTWKAGVKEKGRWLTPDDIFQPEPGDWDTARGTGTRQKRPGIVVITGGEPMLYADTLAFEALVRMGISLYEGGVEIETNGTRPAPHIPGVRYNVSPKLSGAHAGKSKLSAEQYEHWLYHKAIFKFVVSDDDEMAEVDGIVRQHRVPPERVWIMPEGSSRGEALTFFEEKQHVIEWVLARGYNLSVRVHTLIWNNERER